jgi:hypothetical protein
MSGVNKSLLKPTGSVRFVLVVVDLHAYAAGGAHRRTYLQIPHGPRIDITTHLPKLTTKIGQLMILMLRAHCTETRIHECMQPDLDNPASLYAQL